MALLARQSWRNSLNHPVRGPETDVGEINGHPLEADFGTPSRNVRDALQAAPS